MCNKFGWLQFKLILAACITYDFILIKYWIIVKKERRRFRRIINEAFFTKFLAPGGQSLTLTYLSYLVSKATVKIPRNLLLRFLTIIQIYVKVAQIPGGV